MTTGKLAAWGPSMWIAALKPRVSSHRRSSQTIFLKLQRASCAEGIPRNQLNILQTVVSPDLTHAAVSACMVLGKAQEKENMVKPHG